MQPVFMECGIEFTLNSLLHLPSQLTFVSKIIRKFVHKAGEGNGVVWQKVESIPTAQTVIFFFLSSCRDYCYYVKNHSQI